jgi:hypothetical protein
MPNNLGQYYMYEMESKVRTMMNLFNQTLDENGNVAAQQIQYQNISNQDIDNYINESLRALYTEAMILSSELFAIDIYIDVIQDIVQYAFPLNMLLLRNINWKEPRLQPPLSQNVHPGYPSSNSPSAAQPWDYTPMVEVNDPMDKQIANHYFRGPTYRRNGDTFILSRRPQENNQMGIRMNVCILPPALAASTATTPSSATVQGLFGLLAQEVIIYDAACKLSAFKKKQIPEETMKLRDDWHTRFFTSVNNAEIQQSTNIVSTRMIARTYSGRWRRSYGNYGRGY